MLEPLLVLDAESLLLVDHDEAEVLELDVFGQQPVRADDDVDVAALERLDGLELLGPLAEPAEHLDADRVVGHPVAERVVVLLREHGGRHEDGDLLLVEDGLECGPDRHLGLAVADVAADQPVRRLRAFEVGLQVGDRPDLVVGLLVDERVLELALPLGVGREGVAVFARARGVELEQLGGVVLDRALRAALHLRPARAAEHVEPRHVAVGADELRDQVRLGDRHVDLRLLGVLDPEKLLVRILARQRHDTEVAADAVVDVHDVVAGLDLGEVPDGRRPLEVPRPTPDLVAVEDVLVRHGDRAHVGHREARVERADDEPHRVGLGDAALVEQGLEPVELAGVVADEEQLGVALEPGRDALKDLELRGLLDGHHTRALEARQRAERRLDLRQLLLGRRHDRQLGQHEAQPALDVVAEGLQVHQHRRVGQRLAEDLVVGRAERAGIVQDDERAVGQVVSDAYKPVGVLSQRTVLVRRRDADRPHRLRRALAPGVELADRLDLVAEELDPDRQLGVDGPHVEDAAAHAEVPLLLHRAERLVAEPDEPPEQHVHLRFLVHDEARDRVAEHIGRQGLEKDRLDAAQDDGRAYSLRRFNERQHRPDAVADDLRVRFELLVPQRSERRQRLPGGQEHRPCGREVHEVVVERLGLAHAAADREHGRTQLLRGEVDEEGLGRFPDAARRHTPARRQHLDEALNARRILERSYKTPHSAIEPTTNYARECCVRQEAEGINHGGHGEHGGRRCPLLRVLRGYLRGRARPSARSTRTCRGRRGRGR